MNVLDLFSGIGGFSLGLERAGMQTVAFCEIDPYCRKVLAEHWPDVPCAEDITAREFVPGEADVAVPRTHGIARHRRRVHARAVHVQLLVAGPLGVVPGIGETIERSAPVNTFSKVDLPTFG